MIKKKIKFGKSEKSYKLVAFTLMYLKVLVLNLLEWKKGDVFLVMPKLNEFKQDNGKLIVTTGKCLVCGDELLVFGTDDIYICPKCKEILDADNCLVLETMFVEDDRIVTARNCIVPKEQMHTNVPIVCMPSDEFNKLYEIYKTKAN